MRTFSKACELDIKGDMSAHVQHSCIEMNLSEEVAMENIITLCAFNNTLFMFMHFMDFPILVSTVN